LEFEIDAVISDDTLSSCRLRTQRATGPIMGKHDIIHKGDTLCTSGFVDDVMFSQNWPSGASCVFLSG